MYFLLPFSLPLPPSKLSFFVSRALTALPPFLSLHVLPPSLLLYHTSLFPSLPLFPTFFSHSLHLLLPSPLSSYSQRQLAAWDLRSVKRIEFGTPLNMTRDGTRGLLFVTARANIKEGTASPSNDGIEKMKGRKAPFSHQSASAASPSSPSSLGSSPGCPILLYPSHPHCKKIKASPLLSVA